MKRAIFFVLFLFGLVTLIGAGPLKGPVKMSPYIMPEKEKTWVRTSKKEMTREAFMAKADTTPSKISLDESFRKTLLTEASAPQGKVKDRESCHQTFRVLDEKRILLQRDGGMWHAFERAPEVRTFSNNGMQIDSNLNKVFQAVRHLCETANGVPKSPVARMIADTIKERGGKEGARAHLIKMGRAPKDIDIWFEYEAKAEKASTRKVSYQTVEGLIRKTQTLIDGYEDLYHRKVGPAEKDAFLSQTKTLQAVINERLTEVPELTMALREELDEPHLKYIGEH